MNNKTVIDQLRQEVAGKCTCQKMRTANRIVSRRYDEALKPVGIKGSQFTMLTVISLTDDVTLTKLADIMDLERTTLIRNLRPLEREGLVTVDDQGARRGRSATITEKGLATLEAALPRWREAQTSLKKELGEEAWANIHHLLGTLSQAS